MCKRTEFMREISQVIKVTIVKRNNNAVLVEYLDESGERARKILPASDVRGETVTEDALARGIVFGELWEDLIILRATPEKIARELRRRNIWTYADLINNPEAARGAIMKVYGFDIAALLRAAADKN